MQQQTLRSPCHIHGIGLHSGKNVTISLLPAPADSGIVFRVNDGSRQVEIPAKTEYVVHTNNNTCLGRDGVEIGTVEHLLAALMGLEIDNAVVLTQGTEIPAMDGSALPFVARIMEAGRQPQGAPKRYLKITAPIMMEEQDKFAGLYPAEVSMFAFTIDYPHPVVRAQSLKIRLSPQTFVSELAKARTFGFEADLQAMHEQGLALGASLDNAVGLGRDGSVLNEEGLRYADEFVRHKILDAIGDMSLLGYPVLGEYRGVKSGHALNHKLMQVLAKHPERWEIVSGSGLLEAQAV
ncbi:MAG: UDP-3-O-acyl-N-acetylglucosamine deacetylase [SAR324 cluster bacterium]|nr:UDP-3-O-acyl-N-acetylglucosamine deacetylase [SAR324 cluster bacterium]